MTSINIHNLSKSYGDTHAVQHLSLEVKKGELFGLIGPDGAGKTTVFRMLTTLLLPDEGTASIEGWDIVKDYKEIRKHVGYMPGRFSLYQDLTVEENLTFFATVFGTTIAENYDLIKDIYEQIKPFSNRRAGKLSGGMLRPHSQTKSPFVRRAHHGGRCGFAQRVLGNAEETEGARHKHTRFHPLYGRSQPMRPHSLNTIRQGASVPYGTLCYQGSRPVRTASAPARAPQY